MTMASLTLLTILLAQAAVPSPKTPPSTKAPAIKPAVIEGIVVDEAAKPVAGALVVVRPLQGLLESPLSVRSDAKGAFQLKLPGQPLVTIYVEAKGLAPKRLERIRPGGPLRIKLETGGTIDGVVRDGPSKQPVAGVRVEARSAGGQDVPWEWGSGTVETVTEADGRFRLAGLGNGLHMLVASAHGWGRAERNSVKTGSRVELFLFPRGTLSGRVTDRAGQAVSGASVFAEREAAAGAPDVYRPVLSDRQGQFEVAGLEAGTYRIVALEREHAPGIAAGIVVGREDDLRVDVTLEPGVDVTGRLVDSEQRPVAGKVGFADLDGQRVSQALFQVLRTEAGPDGLFRLKLVPPGAHGLAVGGRGFATKRVDVSVAEKAIDLGDITLEMGNAIRGRVRDRAGLPIADARVEALLPMNVTRSRNPSTGSTTSEADGRFTLAGLSPGPYQVRAQALGFGSATRPAEAGAENVELILQPAGTLSGTVVDDSGRGVSSFRLAARASNRPAVGNVPAPFAGKSVDGGDGTFTLEDLTAGEYVVEIAAPELTPSVTPKVVISAGANSDLGRIVLRRGGIVKGTVVDSGGIAVPGARVQLDGQASFAAVRSEAQTGADGEFELRGIEAGRVDLLASHPDYAEARVTGIDVEPARGPSETQITLERGGRIEGSVRKRDGSPVSGVAIGLGSLGPRGQAQFSPRGLHATRSDGSFLCERVAPGRVTLTLMVGSDALRTSTQIKEADVQDGATTLVEFTLSDVLIGGYARQHGAPLAGARLEIRPRSGRMVSISTSSPVVAAAPLTGPERNAATVREDGSFELIVDRPGPHAAILSTSDDKTRFAPREIEVLDADTFALDLSYAGARVAGTVAEEDGDRPIPQATISAKGATALSGPDGRFVLELDEPGKVSLAVRAEGYAGYRREVTVPDAGVSDLRIALRRGGDLSGRVVDAQGRAVPRAFVFAMPTAEGMALSAMQYTQTDGSFVLQGLAEGSLTLLARTQSNDAFAVLANVTPDARDLTLTLRPAGRIALRVAGPDGQPLEGVSAGCSRVNGAQVGGVGGFGTSDAQGALELSVPAGALEVVARHEKLSGKASVRVNAGEVVPLAIELSAAKP
jgi:protocatechuate 3,4-dioxygenase beta subunit